MRAVEVTFLLVLAALLTGICLIGAFHYDYSAGLMLFPLLAAGVTLAIIAVQLGILLAEARRGPAADLPEHRRAAPVAAGAVLPDLLWLVSVVPFIVLLGYPAGLALYLVCTLRRAGEGWPLAIGVAAASLLVSYCVFVRLLGVLLPLFPFWWPF